MDRYGIGDGDPGLIRGSRTLPDADAAQSLAGQPASPILLAASSRAAVRLASSLAARGQHDDLAVGGAARIGSAGGLHIPGCWPGQGRDSDPGCSLVFQPELHVKRVYDLTRLECQ